MKKASQVFNTISLILAIVSIIAGIILIATASGNYYLLGQGIGYLISGPISIIFTSIALHSLNEDDKKVAIGVLDLIFGSLLGGIFYLCWRDDYVPSYNPSYHPYSNSYGSQTTNSSVTNYNKFSSGQQVVLLYDCVDASGNKIDKGNSCTVMRFSDAFQKYELMFEGRRFYAAESMFSLPGATVNNSVKSTPVVDTAPAIQQEQAKNEPKENKSNSNNLSEQEVVDLLVKYKDLLDKGIITQEQFEAKRKELLNL